MVFLLNIVLSAILCLQGYNSYKILNKRPADETALESALVYWIVLGSLLAVDQAFDWLVAWIPFYNTIKSIILLFLAIPHTQAAHYLYASQIRPYLRSHESDIDSMLASITSRMRIFIQTRLRLLSDAMFASMTNGQGVSPNPVADSTTSDVTNAPPSIRDPISGPVQVLSSLWGSYGPSVIASAASLFSQAPSGSAASPLEERPPPSTFSSRERRRQLEAELASLPPEDEYTSNQDYSPMPSASPSFLPSNRPSSTSLRPRTFSSGNGHFDEVEALSDDDHTNDGDVGHEYQRPSPSSWFSWGSGSSIRARGYGRMKAD